MKNLIAIVLSLFFVKAYSQNTVPTKKTSSSYTKHGITIKDDYSWLENPQSPETIKWVEDENKATTAHLEELRNKYGFEKKIKEYDLHQAIALPNKDGKYYYSPYIKSDNGLPVICYRKKLEDYPIELCDLNKIYPGTNTLLNGTYASGSSKFMAYKVSPDGSDNHEIRFVEIDKKQNLEDVLTNVRYSNVAWNLDFGVFYKKNHNLNKIAADSTNQLFYHKLGTKQIDDKLVFEGSKTGTTFLHYTKDGKLIIIEKDKDETIANYYKASLGDPDFTPTKFLETKTSDVRFLSYDEGRIFYSSKEFDWGEIRSFDINNRTDEKVVVPQVYSQLLNGSYFTDDYIFCRYKTIGENYIRVYDKSGNFIRKFDSPDGTEFTMNFYDEQTKSLFVTLSSYTDPELIYKLNVVTGEMGEYFNQYIKAKPTIFPVGYFETKSISFKSRDNKDVPITIIYKKGINLDGNNPTLLKAYGGFGNVTSPYFTSGLLSFLEKGGVFAFAEIRGGGEKGIKWEMDGKNLKKMNSFNDFIDAAEYLIKEKYTSPNKLGITGTSYGGLVVGVAMTKRPDLFKVAIPKMGVFEMIKFDQFTNGKYHLDEYGNPDKKEEFANLLKYSPYHNIDDKINYPVSLIITSENDNRVPPLHSYKFAAKLQNRESQKNPIYLEIFNDSGHSGNVSTYNDYIKSEADFYNFLFFHLTN